MPQYEIHHSCPLDPAQQSTLAAAITFLHCHLFTAPSIFVNVTFHPTTSAIFVGGQARQTNYIIGHLRPRGPDNAAKLNSLVLELTRIWNMHARPGGSGQQDVDEDAPGRLDDARALHNCFIMEDIVAGAEQGFVLAVPSQDGSWVQENMEAFEKRAREGDESMKALVQEVKVGLGKGPVALSG